MFCEGSDDLTQHRKVVEMISVLEDYVVHRAARKRSQSISGPVNLCLPNKNQKPRTIVVRPTTTTDVQFIESISTGRAGGMHISTTRSATQQTEKMLIG